MLLASVLHSSTPSDIRSSLREQLHQHNFYTCPYPLGISDYLEDMSSNLTRSALDSLPLLLLHATPSINLLAALKQPFDTKVLSRTPSSSRKALRIIHDYLTVRAPSVSAYADGNSPSLISNMIPITNGVKKLSWLAKQDRTSHSQSLSNSCGNEILDRSRYADQVDLLLSNFFL